MQDPNLDPKFVPNMEMEFASLDDAFEFYRTYSQLAGFNVKKGRMRYDRRGQDFECSQQGKHGKSPGANRIRKKTTKRKACKAMVCAVTRKDGTGAYFKRIVLEHNHMLHPSPSMTKRMRSHKMKDPAMDEMIDVMHRAKVNHVHVMSILRESVGGSENLNLTERDVQNRYLTHEFLCL